MPKIPLTQHVKLKLHLSVPMVKKLMSSQKLGMKTLREFEIQGNLISRKKDPDWFRLEWRENNFPTWTIVSEKDVREAIGDRLVDDYKKQLSKERERIYSL